MFLHKKIPSLGLLLIVASLCLWVFHPETVQAAVAGSAMPTGLEADIASIMSKIISLLNILTWILFIFLNFVLDPDFIFNLDSGGNFMGMLNQIWQLSRDLMNVAFALILVGTAIYTIVTANKEFVSSHAKKFILSVVLVNFSWFVPQVIIDVSNVAAATIYGIPSLLLGGTSAMNCSYKSSVKEFPACTLVSGSVATKDAVYSCACRAVVNVDIFMSTAQRKVYEAKASDGWDCKGDIICIQTQPWDANLISGHSAILNGLIVNHAHLQTMANVPAPTNSDDIGDMIQFVLVEGIILLIHIALFFPLLAMFVAFLIRIPILWLTMAFMPFVFLSFIIENEYAGMTKKIWEQFLKAAFLPAAVAVPLSVGFILVNAADQLGASPISAINVRLIDGISNFWELLWWLMTLGVLWVGTFTVLEKAGGLYAKTAGTIKSYGEAWGKVALKAPLAIPLPGMSMTPLAALKAFHPRNIDAAISGNEGLRGYVDSLKNGTAGIDNDREAKRISELGDSERKLQLDKLHTDLQDLKTAMTTAAGGGAGAAAAQAEKDRLISKIKTDHNVDLRGNTGSKLDDFVKKLQQNGVNTRETGRDLKQIAEDIKNIK